MCMNVFRFISILCANECIGLLVQTDKLLEVTNEALNGYITAITSSVCGKYYEASVVASQLDQRLLDPNGHVINSEVECVVPGNVETKLVLQEINGSGRKM